VITQLIRLAAFQNPEFYRAQAMRLPTWGKPRVISCAELHPKHIALPRGCLDDALALLEELGIGVAVEDLRQEGKATDSVPGARIQLRIDKLNSNADDGDGKEWRQDTTAIDRRRSGPWAFAQPRLLVTMKDAATILNLRLSGM
jgi:hypothetical protein